MFKPEAKVLADSISPEGKRLVTVEATVNRYMAAEFNTHGRIARNAASSRAIPYQKMRAKAMDDIAYPVSWPKEQKGMSGGDEIADPAAAMLEWRLARNEAVKAADRLHQLGVHKSVCSRLIEPFIGHTIIATSSEWWSFFEQRCHPDAQPEIREMAIAIENAINNSRPRTLEYRQWHMPLILEDEYGQLPLEDLKKISAARVARTSYLTHNGVRDHSADLELYDRLTTHKPGHWSPLEQVATPVAGYKGKFIGWKQLRHFLDPEW